MDKLRSFIEDNKDAFDNIPLPEGHTERFHEKLSEKKSIKKKQYILYTLLVAASVGLLLLITTPHQWVEEKLNRAQEICENREEFQELRIYYEMQIFDLVSQMENITQENDSPAIAGLMDAGKQVVLATQRFEKNILPELPCSENGIFALNQHYSNSIESLHIMLNQMQHYTKNN